MTDLKKQPHSSSHSGIPVIFGEVLFDCFDNGDTVLGGAPFNVAWHLQAFGLSPLMITKIGRDAQGTTVRLTMEDWGMDTSAVQTDPHLPTGRVTITTRNQDPEYEIYSPVAYDEILTDDIPSQTPPSLIYHGSLALRSETSRNTCYALCNAHNAPVFVDVNLRSPWWRKDHVMDMIHHADWVKLNTNELQQLSGDNGYALDTTRHWISSHELAGIIVTDGPNGARIVTGEDVITGPPPLVTNIIDTVGAGDAFSAVFILGLMKDWDLATTLQRAQDFAAMIVAQRGATTESHNLYSPYHSAWAL